MQKHVTTRKMITHSTNLLGIFKLSQKLSMNLATFWQNYF